MKVAVLHNRRPDHFADHLLDDAFEEYDSAETIEAICDALATLGVHPQPVDAGPDFLHRLESGFDFVFNIAEGEGNRCREAIPAAACELLHLPYTGSDPLTLAATLDKAITRRIVSPDVPVARAAMADEPLGSLRYPVIVKPNAEGSSKGIRQRSFCVDLAAAEAQIEWLRSRYPGPALVEEFLPGTEVTVGITGNGPGTRVVAMMEIGPVSPEPERFVYSLEMKREFRTRICYFNPPRLPEPTLDLIRSYALRAYELLGCRDIARIDFRLDGNGHPHFLECNPLPGLDPETSDLVIATRSSIGYTALVCGILRDAAARHGISL